MTDLRMPYQLAQGRFDSDPLYRAMVESLVAVMERLELTPSEVREAAVFACIRFETYRMRRFEHLPFPLGEPALSDMRREADESARRIRELREWLEGRPR